MPDYEYQCRDCKKIFSLHLTIGEHEKEPHPPCPGCGGKNTEQMLSVTTVITSKKT